MSIKRSCCSAVLVTLLSVLLGSCLNKESAVVLPPHLPGEEVLGEVQMGSDYRQQVFYSLGNNSVVSTALFVAWDLGFETSPEGWHVVLNGAKTMSVHRTAKTDIAAVKITDTVGVPAVYDMPSGSFDSTAIGDWRSGQVYIINRGYDEDGDALGFYKIKVIAVTASAYTVQFAELSGGAVQQLDVPKDEAYNLCHLSFDNGGKVLKAEPPKNEWDVVFTKYTHIYYDLDNTPYSVVGCMLNRNQTLAAQDKRVRSFRDITISSALELELSSHINTIGFDWKAYNGTTYTVDTAKCYVVRNAGGQYFKLHFIGFLDKSGVKGNPAWEAQRL